MRDERQALIAAILESPDDDTSRMVYADWLDEHAGQTVCPACQGVPPDFPTDAPEQPICLDCLGVGYVQNGFAERAAFIRFQIADPTATRLRVESGEQRELAGFVADAVGLAWGFVEWSRGFVETVSCFFDDWIVHGPAICREHPVQPHVGMITDRVPFASAEYRGHYRWFSTLVQRDFFNNLRSDVPPEIFDRMASTTPPEAHYPGEDRLEWFFSTPEEARLALARACIAWACSS